MKLWILIFLGLVGILFLFRIPQDLFKETISNRLDTQVKKGQGLCVRVEPYQMEPEFVRAISLIIDRLENSKYSSRPDLQQKDREDARGLNSMKNCLNIQYASNEEEISGAEGVFVFDENSTKENLRIFVSPKYQVKDDLLTAILLRHELSHAYFFASDLNDVYSCLENEAHAFENEIFFLVALNEEEIKSINGRYNESAEAKNVIDLSYVPRRYSGATMFDKTLSFVSENPFYQNQCVSQ